MTCKKLGSIHAVASGETFYNCPVHQICSLVATKRTKLDGSPIQVCGDGCRDYEPNEVAQAGPADVVMDHPKANFCYFAGTNRPGDIPMISAMLKRMRAVGVKEDLHVFAPAPIEGAISHLIPHGTPWRDHMAKLDFARKLAGSAYEYVAWLDTDNVFVRHPGDLKELIRDNPMFYAGEADITHPTKTKEDGWYFKKHEYIVDLFRAEGATNEKIYSGNGGFWILRTSEINAIADRAEAIYQKWKAGPWPHVSDETALACVAAILVKDPENSTTGKTDHIWACDWADVYKHRLPDGQPWTYTDWMTGKKWTVNPAIVHAMRSKHLLGQPNPAHQGVQVNPQPLQVKEPVGTKLSEILKECGVERPPDCDCNKWTTLMNQGIEWCREHRNEIVDHLRQSSSKVGWLAMAKVALKGHLSIDSLIDEAIKRATPVPASPPVNVDFETCNNRMFASHLKADDSLKEDTTIWNCAVKGFCIKRKPSGISAEKLEGLTVCEQCDSVNKKTLLRHFYRSIQDQWRDAYQWSSELPENIIGFCGVHRSGIGIAQALACCRNVHYVDWFSLVAGERPWEDPIRRRFGKPHSTDGFILVCEDTCWSGGTLHNIIKPALAHRTDVNIKYGALYCGSAGRREIDYFYEQLPHIRQTFQTNMFHDYLSMEQAFDLDGVLCSDCPGPEVDHDEAKYLEWMATVKPLIQPVNPLGYIVTGRLEKYRPQTEAWLARHGITFKQLIMFEAAQSNEERNSRHHEVIAYKAANYAKLKSTLFVESCDHQAEQIASMTGKSVVAWPSQKTFNCD